LELAAADDLAAFRHTGLHRSVEPLLLLVQQGGHRGVGELRELTTRVREALELARCAAASLRWNVYRVAQLARRMEAVCPCRRLAATASSPALPLALALCPRR
jgi:hypothetical protein